MDRFEIINQLRRKGITQATIANKLEIKPPTVCNVIKGTAESRRVKKAIAQALGLHVEQIWPNNNHRAA